ncbi:putative nuclear elongation and deformation protein 1 [Elsinoe fawcettii]|nr:putative nuclear elongation and deformation protein 1 [Elsinoe fawcettii]
MQYVRSISGSVSKTWNSINPATLSGAIDVIVVEHEDGTLACSPFHVRFGKFSLLRPHEKKVEFKVNDVKREYPMKLGEGGEAFFVFETTTSVPEAMQTSPLVSPAQSPEMRPSSPDAPALPDSESLELTGQLDGASRKLEESSSSAHGVPYLSALQRTQSGDGDVPTLSSSLGEQSRFGGHLSAHSKLPVDLHRSNTDHGLPPEKIGLSQSFDSSQTTTKPVERPVSPMGLARSSSPPPMTSEEAKTRAINLSKKLWTSNIPSQVTDQGDLMLDMTGYKSSDAEALRAEVIARKILSEELEGNYDIGSLIGADEKGNLWIYSSEEAKEQANKRLASSLNDLSRVALGPSTDAISDPGYHSDDARSESSVDLRAPIHFRHDSDSAVGMSSPPFPGAPEQKSYAKTLRLTSDQLKSLELKPGQNTMSFTVNRATCTACIWLWKYDVPIIISDIDGTITKSDALGHVLNMIGRDWTHLGVAKLYTEIAANGYNFLYLTSRSVGQADTTRAYLAGVVQEGGYKLPKGPVIMSPDRTMAALRREVYLRKPEVFKMACLRDIMALFLNASGNRAMFVDPGSPPGEPSSPTQPTHQTARSGENPDTARKGIPFYAGFGNRLTDALSYRSVNIPSTRIFTINSSSEVSLDLSTLSKYRTGYTTMRDIVDHYFPPTGLLVKGGGEEFTDFTYWRDKPLELDDFSASESEDEDDEEDEDVGEEEGDADADGEEELDEEGEDERAQRTPLFTPGILSEDEYATMAESLYSTGGRPSMEQSLMGESMYSARDKAEVTIEQEEEDEREQGDDEEGAQGRRRGETVTHRQEDVDADDGDDEGEEEDVAGSLELDEQQKDVQRELRGDLKGLAKALNSPGRQRHGSDEGQSRA